MRLILAILSACIIASCTNDSISRKYDYTSESYDFDGVHLGATLKGSAWEVSEENGRKVREWVGPYHLSIHTTQDLDSKVEVSVLSGSIRYIEGEPLLQIPNIKLSENRYKDRFRDDTKIIHSYKSIENIDLEYNPIVIELNVTYTTDDKSTSKKVSFTVNPNKSSKSYNSSWEKLMSV